jgi:hypothetical protein
MTIKSIRTGWTGISALAGNDQWFSDFESIASVTVGAGGQATVTFSSIPDTYQHLQLRFIEREESGGGTATSQLVVRFNSDSGSNYTLHRLFGNGSSALADNAGGTVTSIRVSGSCGSASTANVFGAGVIDILDYRNTNKNTTVRSFAGADFNGADGIIFLSSGLWMNTAAITQIDITNLSAVDHNQHSHFALYGIRG